jgi:hypothetical protein
MGVVINVNSVKVFQLQLQFLHFSVSVTVIKSFSQIIEKQTALRMNIITLIYAMHLTSVSSQHLTCLTKFILQYFIAGT